jgi:hypothetical protein
MIVYPVRDICFYPIRISVLGESFFVGESFRRMFVLKIIKSNFVLEYTKPNLKSNFVWNTYGIPHSN